MAQIKLDIITQEKQLLSTEVSQLTVPALTGEITILPFHAPLFTRLGDGLVRIVTATGVEEIAVLGGFVDVGPQNRVTVMADSAIRADDINLAKAEAAKQQAEEAMKSQVSEVEFRQAEASLRRALLEIKVARRKAPRSIPTTSN